MAPVRQRSVALILARELAENLLTPMWIWDEDGVLVYLNEPAAAAIVGSSLDDLGPFRQQDVELFRCEDLDGNPIDVDDLPSAIALREQRPAHRVLRMEGLDGVKRKITVTAIPLFGRNEDFMGVMSLAWALPEGAPGE